jgi:hypothetical protein
MAPIPEQDKLKERTLLLTLFALFLFVSPLTIVWASNTTPWLFLFVLWLLIILLGAWLQIRHGNHDL